MKAKKITWQSAATAFLILALALPVLAQTAPDRKRLDRDLDIMEGILQRLLTGKESYHFIDGSTKGFFLDNYGIIFYIRQGGPVLAYTTGAYTESLGLYEDHIEAISKEAEGVIAGNEEEKEAEVKKGDEKSENRTRLLETFVRADRVSREDRRKKSEARRKEVLESTKTKLHEFFTKYASAIGQLNDRNKVTVLVNFKDWDASGSDMTYLTGTVLKGDLESFRRKAISPSAFSNKIHYELAGGDDAIESDISIMSEIFTRALSNNALSRSSHDGIYIKGLGALFFMDFSGTMMIRGNGNWIIASDEVDEALEHAFMDGKRVTVVKEKDREKARQEADRKREERILEIKNELFDLVADYGHTLRLGAGEKIVLNVNIGSGLIVFPRPAGKTEASQMIIQLAKNDVDAFNEGKLSRSGLKNKMVVHTY